ncbi:L-ascorbate metabolism protein UlaG (beta-lactamase superfamily) [Natronocella acetinitrilica]|uniref:L-ascorbate metabolism protein UlaG (Beta-lactamase superfamily) n=1 Tax=Natronocella acetinitrilica TaxID=414046 RepID=A0AAE3G2A7_9GAMM|nr:MBL fold metallo-hydrolase [Natronocella acetinitrilica]MCP1673823.1 L-ascorbate metabolism protein UlaG (beta-lactamase superfamily) [Natronocella acetinitrilica]
MNPNPTIRYYGWSALSINTNQGNLFFDPFYRKYCGAQWFSAKDFDSADLICVTHGHEEHFLDVPDIAKSTGATVIGPRAVTRFLRRRTGLAEDKLITIDFDAPLNVPGFTLSAFKWQHRDINLVKAMTKAVFQGNTTQLAWAWSSATNAPFYAPYTGYHVELPNGTTVLNYNEGFNTKMTDKEITALGQRFKTDVLLAGMQLDFVDDVARGAAALDPKIVLLYPPHEKFHDMMGAKSRPWSEFAAAVKACLPEATVIIAEPGTAIDAVTGEVVEQPVESAVA